jgi:predicted short-subunit dehydrogenase-like oxidoreductase (DUF2520 family)
MKFKKLLGIFFFLTLITTTVFGSIAENPRQGFNGIFTELHQGVTLSKAATAPGFLTCFLESSRQAFLLGQGVKAIGQGGKNLVYQALNKAGQVEYVGITNSLARRAAEQLAQKGIRIGKLLGNLSRADARAIEQALIEIHGLGKNGGTLINKINSIGKSNPVYAEQLKRGYELLKQVGY